MMPAAAGTHPPAEPELTAATGLLLGTDPDVAAPEWMPAGAPSDRSTLE
jgi:hypothetical protein